MTERVWDVESAGRRFTELLRGAEAGEPQIVTREGAEVAVVVGAAEYRALRGQRPSFKEFIRQGPGFDDLELPERRVEPPRVTFD